MILSTDTLESLDLPPTIDTRVVGKLLGQTAPAGALLLLSGPTGSGKTSLAQGVAQGLGIKGRVVSPTFLYLQIYEPEGDTTRRIGFLHADWDRVSGEPEDLTETLTEGSENRVTLVEWGEKLSQSLCRSFKIRLRILIRPQTMGRHLSLVWESSGSVDPSIHEWRRKFLEQLKESVGLLPFISSGSGTGKRSELEFDEGD